MIPNPTLRQKKFRKSSNDVIEKGKKLAQTINNSQHAFVAISTDVPPIVKAEGHPSIPEVVQREGWVPRANGQPMEMIEMAMEKLLPDEATETLQAIDNMTTQFINNIMEEKERRGINN